jgi:hypothetical protein
LVSARAVEQIKRPTAIKPLFKQFNLIKSIQFDQVNPTGLKPCNEPNAYDAIAFGGANGGPAGGGTANNQ